MKHNPIIKNAIDESLGSVRFDRKDTLAVLHAVRGKRAPQARTARRFRYDWLAAAAMLLLIASPLGLLAARSLGSGTPDVITAAGHGETPAYTAAPSQDAAKTALITESEAIRAARACFEAQCNTAVFTFEEYTVSVSLSENGAEYAVQMHSIYDNGCMFSVAVSATDGSVIAHSAPEQATVPALLRRSSSEIQAWYDRYGAYSFMWPLDVQAEFSRRYAGAAQRMPDESEAAADVILAAAKQELARSGHASSAVYAVLHDGSGFPDELARYQVFGFAETPAENNLPDTCAVLTYFAADGALESNLTVSTSTLK